MFTCHCAARSRILLDTTPAPAPQWVLSWKLSHIQKLESVKYMELAFLIFKKIRCIINILQIREARCSELM